VRRVDLLWLDDPAATDPGLTGGKGSALARLAPRHTVPPGFCITTTAWSPGPPTDQPCLTADLAATVTLAYAQLAVRCGVVAPATAVRSSAADEDGPSASFAGQHETFINVSGAEAVLVAVARCFATAGSEQALAYRRRHGLPTTARMAVVVQQLVLADVSVVAFSVDPTGAAQGEVLINAAWGLGESVVGGTVTPDTYAVSRDDPAAVRCTVADKHRMTVALAEGTAETDVPAFLRRAPTLDLTQASAVAQLACDLERETGAPVDIECAFRGDRLYLLQCRPITTLGARVAGKGGR